MPARTLPSLTERTIASVRVLLGASSLMAVWLDPAEPERYVTLTYGLHVVYVTYALSLAAWSWNHGTSRPYAIATHLIDIATFSVFQYLTLGPSSPFFMYFIFALICGEMRWGRVGTIGTALLVTPIFIIMGLSMRLALGTQFELNRFIIRIVYLGMLATLLIYLGEHENRLREELERLAGWPAAGGALPTAIGPVLDHAARVMNAGEAFVAWEINDEPWTHVARWARGGLSTARYGPGEFTGPPGDEGASTSARFQTSRLSGQARFSDLHMPTAELMVLTEVVAREIGNSLEQIVVVEELRAAAVSEQRLGVARDLHDGVLQSLTGLRFELQNLATDLPSRDTSALRDRLHSMERALAMEQRELRLFIEQLKPRPGVPTDNALLRDLETLRERIALEWKTPVTVRVAPQIPELPPELERAVPPMVHEAVVNALKHAEPSRVWVDVQTDHRTLRIVVGDDGRGFPFKGRYEHATLAERRIGPASLCERTASLGGQVTVESEGTGSRVEIALPLAGAA